MESILLILEFLINIKSNLNFVILNSFNVDLLVAAHEPIDYSWALFYPSLYGFAIWQAFNSAKVNNNKVDAKAIEKRTYLSGFFIGLVIGMDLGLFWHDNRFIKAYSFLDYPVFNGIIFGLMFGIKAHFLELKLYRKKPQVLVAQKSLVITTMCQ